MRDFHERRVHLVSNTQTIIPNHCRWQLLEPTAPSRSHRSLPDTKAGPQICQRPDPKVQSTLHLDFRWPAPSQTWCRPPPSIFHGIQKRLLGHLSDSHDLLWSEHQRIRRGPLNWQFRTSQLINTSRNVFSYKTILSSVLAPLTYTYNEKVRPQAIMNNYIILQIDAM